MTVWWPAPILTPQLIPGSPFLFLLHLMMEIVSLCLFLCLYQASFVRIGSTVSQVQILPHAPCKLVLIKTRKLSIVSETYSGRVILSNLGLSGAVILLPRIFSTKPLGYLIHRSECLFLSFLGFSNLFSQSFSHSILPFSFHSPWKLSKS